MSRCWAVRFERRGERPADARGLGRDGLLRQPGDVGDAPGGGAGPRAGRARCADPVRGRGVGCGGRLRADGGRARGDAAAPRAGVRERVRERPQRVQGADAAREPGGRSRGRAQAAGRAAGLRCRVGRAARVALGADGARRALRGAGHGRGGRGGSFRRGRDADRPGRRGLGGVARAGRPGAGARPAGRCRRRRSRRARGPCGRAAPRCCWAVRPRPRGAWTWPRGSPRRRARPCCATRSRRGSRAAALARARSACRI